MATRVIADYLEVLQTSGAAARVTMLSAEALLGGDPGAKGRVTMLSAEALFTYAHTPGTGPLRFGTPTVYTASGTIATSTSITTHLQRFSGSGLLVGALFRSQNSPSNPQTVAATWNGVSLTAAWSTLTPVGGKAFVWTGWLPSAAQGYQTLALTLSQTQQDIVLFAVEVWGYDSGGAIGATGNTFSGNSNASATTSASVTTTATGSGVIGFGWASYGTASTPAMGGSLVLASNGNSGTGNTSDMSAAAGFGYRAAAGSFSGTYTPATQDPSQGLALIEIKADPSYWTPILLSGSTALSLAATGSLRLATPVPRLLQGTVALTLAASGSLLVTPPVPRHLNIAALGLSLSATGNLLVGTRAAGSGLGGGGVGAWLSGTAFNIATPGLLPSVIFGATAQTAPTNHLLNAFFAGAVAGDPGTTPNSWTRYTFGLDSAIVAVGTTSGGETYIDVRVHGTNEPSPAYPFMAEINAAGASGQTWRLEAKVALVGGSLAGLTPQLVVNEGDDEGGYLDGTSENLSLTGSVQEFAVQRTFNNGSAALVFAGFQIAVPADAEVDATLRFQAPRLLRVS